MTVLEWQLEPLRFEMKGHYEAICSLYGILTPDHGCGCSLLPEEEAAVGVDA